MNAISFNFWLLKMVKIPYTEILDFGIVDITEAMISSLKCSFDTSVKVSNFTENECIFLTKNAT